MALILIAVVFSSLSIVAMSNFFFINCMIKKTFSGKKLQDLDEIYVTVKDEPSENDELLQNNHLSPTLECDHVSE